MAVNAHKVIDLLQQYPQLASEDVFHFTYPDESNPNILKKSRKTYYPLVFFIWNNFDKDILNQIYNLYPGATANNQDCQGFPWRLQVSLSFTLQQQSHLR